MSPSEGSGGVEAHLASDERALPRRRPPRSVKVPPTSIPMRKRRLSRASSGILRALAHDSPRGSCPPAGASRSSTHAIDGSDGAIGPRRGLPELRSAGTPWDSGRSIPRPRRRWRLAAACRAPPADSRMSSSRTIDGAAVHAERLLATGDQEDQPDVRVREEVAQPVEPLVARDGRESRDGARPARARSPARRPWGDVAAPGRVGGRQQEERRAPMNAAAGLVQRGRSPS